MFKENFKESYLVGLSKIKFKFKNISNLDFKKKSNI